MKTLLTLGAALLAAAPSFGQHARSATLVETTLADSASPPAVASNGDHSSVVWVDGSAGAATTIQFSHSDGRGTNWTPPFRIDAGPLFSAKTTNPESVQSLGPRIYAAWIDTRFGNQELFFNSSFTGGVAWLGEVRIQKNYAVGFGDVEDWTMKVVLDPAGGADFVYFLLAVRPPGGGNRELYLVTSNTAGVAFNAPVPVPQGIALGAAEIQNFDIEAVGPNVAVVWQDSRGAAGVFDVWAQRSTNGGGLWLPFDQKVNTVAAGTASTKELDLALDGTELLAAWTDLRPGTGKSELRINTSPNLGAGWLAADVQIGGYTPGVDEVESISAWSAPGMHAAAWTDDRSGAREVYVGTSPAAGGAWVDTQLSTGGGIRPTLAGSEAYVAVSWMDEAAAKSVLASYSRDGGAAWIAAPDLDQTASDVEDAAVTFNAHYGNFVAAWAQDDSGLDHVYAGGFRPATLNIGMLSVSGGWTFEVEHFSASESGLDFGVLLSGGAGTALLPDGRALGLLPDAILAASAARIPGTLSGVLAADGTGAISGPGMPAVLNGVTVHCVAFAYNLATAEFGSITDVETALVLP